MFQTRFIEEIKTGLNLNKVFIFENRAVCEITWNNIVGQDRTQMTIWRMRITFLIPKATNTHS